MKRFLMGQRIRVKDRRSALQKATGTVVELRLSDAAAVIEMDGDLPACERRHSVEHPHARRVLLQPHQCGPVRQEGAR